MPKGRYTLTRIPGGNVLIVTPKWDSGYVEQKFLGDGGGAGGYERCDTRPRAVVRCAVKDASQSRTECAGLAVRCVERRDELYGYRGDLHLQQGGERGI